MFPNFLNFFKSLLTDYGKNDKVLWNVYDIQKKNVKQNKSPKEKTEVYCFKVFNYKRNIILFRGKL